MKKLHFEYSMKIDYSKEVSICHFTIKCIPQNTARQSIRNMHIELFPDAAYYFGTDGLGNRQIYGKQDMVHTCFHYRICGDAVTGLSDYEEAENSNQSMIFAHPYGKNVAGERIRGYYSELIELPEIKALLEKKEGTVEKLKENNKACGNVDEVDSFSTDIIRKQPLLFQKMKKSEKVSGKPWRLELASALMKCLYERYEYKPLVTNLHTTAEEAFELGCGVCQDYAHIFISLLHLAGISARYITGFIVGEGASHAWVEVLSDGKWYGFDPTHNRRVTEDYIRVGVGRDAHDCAINRGIMQGGGLHVQTVEVNVTTKS